MLFSNAEESLCFRLFTSVNEQDIRIIWQKCHISGKISVFENEDLDLYTEHIHGSTVQNITKPNCSKWEQYDVMSDFGVPESDSECHKWADINMCLNNRRDSPLFLAVKLSRKDIVKVLLLSPGCNLAHQNINYYSPLDLALVMVFDNQKEPRQSACWDILELLLEAGAESACPDAMLYVIRTALKLNDDQFIFRLIHTLTGSSKSLDLHTLLLRKLHRHQPMYSGNNSDVFFECASDFSVKLMKLHNSKDSLQHIVACLPYYADSHWDVRERRNSLFVKLIVFLSVVGWKWTDQADLQYMVQICPDLARWCYQMLRTVPSLTHLCRITLTSDPSARQFIIPSKVPNILMNYLNFSDIDNLAPFTSSFDFNSVQL